MSRLLSHFAGLRERGRTALAPYFMAGYPDLDTSFRLIKTAAQSGADLIELGMPFSDPLADGPTIQRAGVAALEHPFTVEELIDRFGKEKSEIPIPVVLMTYYNPIYQLGLEETAKRAADAGLDGFIVPDMPTEESEPFLECCKTHDLDLVPLIAPTSSAARIRMIDSKATGILYYVSRLGITGARTNLPEELVSNLDEYRQLTTHPSVVGFGISSPEHAAMLRDHTDGIVIASALIDRLDQAAPGDREKCVAEFLEPISKVLG